MANVSIQISQGSLVTPLKRAGQFYNGYIQYFPGNSTVKEF